MSPLLPVALYGLEVPPGEIMVPAAIQFPATVCESECCPPPGQGAYTGCKIRITMAAIDPTAVPETDSEGNVPSLPRSTLKIIKTSSGKPDSDSEEDENDALERLLGGGDSDEESGSEEEANGGPSDPSKLKKARQEAAIKKLLELTQEESDDEMEDADANGSKSKKGKAKASEEDESEGSDEESGDEDDLDLEDYVVCTLDTERNYQQPLDLVIGEGEQVFFVVSGTHTIYLTGNYVVDQDEEDDGDDSDDEDYDLPPGLDELDDSELSDELDEIEGLDRIKEVDTDEEEAPKLVDTKKKGKKRPAEEEAEDLDEMVAADSKKLSKKQQKKLKTEAAAKEAAAKVDSPASAKKVQFAKELEQGPTGPAKDDKKAAPSVRVTQGVTIDDRKTGTGRTVKNGDKVGLRYIGKLQNGKVFDANKKGPPFSFKVGKGEVIKGWDIGLVGMAIGGERRLTIPAHLAYGSKGVPGIPGNSTLIFDIKLLEIK
ncbi:hypothetical protein B0T16DRAFT_61579 [Cercophora newfieldiana]|uniref:FK506-binding protein n=1 Tax=Cercophora newfieldiana TaxID=92897 RepID=A0AA39YRU8_9PEZI|nr:hypothetical protein B0T16DRAFT_61579 [Cercophora newfieldiana]